MYKIDEIKMLRLGQRDENLARSLPFDCSDWLEQYPEASVHILFRRPGESAIVPMSTTLEGTTLTWLIHDFEVGKTGIGNAEFRAVDTAGLRRKSRIIPCSIEETLLGDDETVLYTQDQVDETLAHISEAAQAAQAAKASEEAAALSAQEAGESAASAGTAANVAVGARDAAQAAQNAAETAQHQAEAAQSGVHADAEAAEQAKVAAQAAQAGAQGAASQASADRTATESARADAEAAATHAEAVVEGIDQAGAEQVAAVNAAGATQVGNVNAAGTTQVNAVQAKGTEVINSIPADYSTLSTDVTDLKSAMTQKADNTHDLPLVWTANKTILRGGGDRDQTNVYATLDYIPVKAGQVLEMLVYCPGTADNVVFYNDSKEVVGYTNNSTRNPITYTVAVDGYMRLSNSPSQIPTANTYVRVTNAEYPSIMDLQGQITANDDKTVGLLSGADYTYNFEWTDNGYINSNGGISSSANFIYTPDYYPVIPEAVLDVNLYAVGVSDVAITFYNTSKVALSPRIYTYGGQITVPENAAYMRCSNNITQIPKNEAYVKSHVQDVPNLTYFNIDRETDILGESVKKTHVSTTAIRKTYKGNINRQKRFLAIGFDDLRNTDITMIMPLLEKYRARATFNKVFYYSDVNPTDKAKTWRVFLGDHELGDHTFHHYSFPYFDPLWNGQNPASPDGNQTPFPTNDDFRADAGDGKNVFGKTLTANVNIGGVSGVTWANLTDAQCQTIREAYSVMKNNDLITILDPLYNKYFGTTGTSAGSWDSTTGKYTGGIYTGCSTSANHEVWERINECIAAYTKCELGIDWDMYTWSRPGTNVSALTVTYDGGTYYDPAHQYLASPQSRFVSSLTGKSRSWTDVLLAFGYKVSHDYPVYGDLNYKWMSRQMFFNASLSKPNAISTPTNKSVSYSQIQNAYPESYFSGTKSKAAQMYDTDGQFRTFIENVRKNTANGMIHMEMIDSNDNYSFRVFFENVLRYCEAAGIEVITKAEAYDIAFNNIISDGNLIGNTELRNTAAEFITDSTNMPTNPDGYGGTCSVTVDDNGIPVLVTGGNTDFVVFGVPYGKIKYTADVKGAGTIKFYGCKNNVNMSAGYTSLMLLGTLTVDSASDFTPQTFEFTVPKAELQEYEPNYEGYGNRIMALKIVYSTGLNIKNIMAVKD